MIGTYPIAKSEEADEVLDRGKNGRVRVQIRSHNIGSLSFSR